MESSTVLSSTLATLANRGLTLSPILHQAAVSQTSAVSLSIFSLTASYQASVICNQAYCHTCISFSMNSLERSLKVKSGLYGPE